MKHQHFWIIGNLFQVFVLIFSIFFGGAIGYWVCLNEHSSNEPNHHIIMPDFTVINHEDLTDSIFELKEPGICPICGKNLDAELEIDMNNNN